MKRSSVHRLADLLSAASLMLGLVCSPASAAKAPKASATTSTVIFRVEYQGTGKFHRQSESKQSYQFCGPTTLDETDSTTFTWHLIWYVRMHPRAAADAVVVIGQPSGTFTGVADVTVSGKSPVDLDNSSNGCHSSDAACHGSVHFANVEGDLNPNPESNLLINRSASANYGVMADADSTGTDLGSPEQQCDYGVNAEGPNGVGDFGYPYYYVTQAVDVTHFRNPLRTATLIVPANDFARWGGDWSAPWRSPAVGPGLLEPVVAARVRIEERRGTEHPWLIRARHEQVGEPGQLLEAVLFSPNDEQLRQMPDLEVGVRARGYRLLRQRVSQFDVPHQEAQQGLLLQVPGDETRTGQHVIDLAMTPRRRAEHVDVTGRRGQHRPQVLERALHREVARVLVDELANVGDQGSTTVDVRRSQRLEDPRQKVNATLDVSKDPKVVTGPPVKGVDHIRAIHDAIEELRQHQAADEQRVAQRVDRSDRSLDQRSVRPPVDKATGVHECVRGPRSNEIVADAFSDGEGPAGMYDGVVRLCF